MSGALVVIGNFDGVHRGHQAVLESAVAEAERRALAPMLLTFFPHPLVVLGRQPPPLLTRQARKRELVARAAPSVRFVEERFDVGYAGQSPLEFAQHLRDLFDAKHVVVGENFRFGKDRAGDVQTLAEIGDSVGFTVGSEAMRGDASGSWSSTRVRGALAAGDIDQATSVLGRPHMLSGVVVRGKQLGRTLGFPTCNLGDVEEALPPLGVYAALVDRAIVPGGPGPGSRIGGTPVALAKGAMSIGTNPTTDGDDSIKVEVFLFDLNEDLYGASLRVHIVRRLRSEAKFDDLATLVAQMNVDVAEARGALDGFSVNPASGAFG